MNKQIVWGCLSLMVSLAFARESQAQAVYQRQHDVLVEAIKKGHAEGVLKGPAADLFSKQFKSNGVLLVSADVIQEYPNPECKRLKMVYVKKEAMSDKGPQDFTMETKLNYCLDGKPPINLEKAQ